MAFRDYPKHERARAAQDATAAAETFRLAVTRAEEAIAAAS